MRRRPLMAAVMIGVDPHKASHTAAAVGPAGEPLGDVPVRAPAAQAEQLLAWAAVWPERTWAVEGAPGWGTCWPSSSSRPGKWAWTSSPRRPPGCGCRRRGTPAKTTPPTPAQSRLPRCRGILGAGGVMAAAVLGPAGNRSRLGDRDRFAAYNGTAPIEVSSGDRKIHRLSLRGNRRLNHAIHMAAVTQIRYKHSPGRAYFDRKIAEGKTGKEALRCLKRQISDAIYARLIAGTARRTPADANGPGGQSGNGSVSSAAGWHPRRRLFGPATPGPAPSLRPCAPARRAPPCTPLN